MGFIELFVIAVGLSMDAFAVSLCKGLCMKRFNLKQAAMIAGFFGGFQALMPLIGWAIGVKFSQVITSFDHWIAFALLLIIGGKMLWEALKKDDESPNCDVAFKVKDVFVMAIATSIDALAVGVTFAFLHVSIVPAMVVIGLITFVLSAIGVYVGHRFGAKFKTKAEMAGGIVLIFIGFKILLEHLGVLHF